MIMSTYHVLLSRCHIYVNIPMILIYKSMIQKRWLQNQCRYTNDNYIRNSCVVLALIHQNTFVERWNDIQNALAPDQKPQLHPSIKSPQPSISASSPIPYSASPLFLNVTNPASPASIFRNSIVLLLPPTAHVELQTGLQSHTLIQSLYVDTYSQSQNAYHYDESALDPHPYDIIHPHNFPSSPHHGNITAYPSR